ncbi:MAG: tetratricopeptide repeat protein [Planctomycetes bacterium]|nr:tetratricopeptide repeat protein [Planctomycetota bacterium]
MSSLAATCAGRLGDALTGAHDDDLQEDLGPVPEVMFLPLAVPNESGFGELDFGVLARRIPDFVHQVLNQGRIGPTGVLEVQSPPEEGPVTWVVMDAPPEPDDAFDLLPEAAEVRAVVTGELVVVAKGLRVEFHVYFAEDADGRFSNKVGGVIGLDDPVVGLLQLARRLARMLELPFPEPPRTVLTHSGQAFFRFLQGLDNAMLLSGDLQIDVQDDRAGLMQPFVDALTLDPGFGLALRVAQTTMSLALQGSQIDHDAARLFLDRCYSAHPVDGEGCVAVAEQLREMGDDQRAMAWLQHATHLDPPPARGLENLGILFANRGDMVAARELWLRGVLVDGHPDFFAHLARLHFAEEGDLNAWEMIMRGLRSLLERTARAGEWEVEERGAGVLLQYLHEHLLDRKPPDDVIEGLLDLRGLLAGEDRIYLGLCLAACQKRPDARAELVAANGVGDLDIEARDLCVRAMLTLDVVDFEKRLTRAAEKALRGNSPKEALADLHAWQQLQPSFWPALYYAAVVRRRIGEVDVALDLLVEANRLAPGRSEVNHEMAILFDKRGNPKRALELVEVALRQRPDDLDLHVSRVEFLLRLGRSAEARECLELAKVIEGADHRFKELRKRIAE